MRLVTLLRIILSFFTALVFIITVIWLPPWNYVLETHFVMSNKTLTGLTNDGKKQEKLVIPQCTEKIGDYAFYGNSVLKFVYLTSQLQQISDCAFEHQAVFRNATRFCAPNQRVVELLKAVGIPESQICYSADYEVD